MTERPRVVLAGCGQIGMLGHLPALRRLHEAGKLELAGVCDLDLDRAKAAAGQFRAAQFGTDWRRLVEQTKAHAISFCFPPRPNAEAAIEALGAGLHVMCEKPPGVCRDQAERMADAQGSQVAMIAFNRRYAPLYRLAWSRSNQLGAPRALYGRFTRAAMAGQPSNTVGDWITSDGSHILDLAIATIGFPEGVEVARHRAGTGPDNIWTIQLRAAEASAVLLLGFAAGRRLERFEWTGPGYDAVLELPDRGEWHQQGAAADMLTAADVSRSNAFEVNYGFCGEYEAFAAAVSGTGAPPPNDFHYGAKFMTLVEQILTTERRDSRTVAPPFTRTITPRVSAGVASRRPTIQFLQTPTAARQYFTAEQVATLSAVADVRFAPMTDPADAEAIVLGWSAPRLTEEQLSAARNLKLVVVLGSAIGWALPLDSLMSREIAVCNTADAIARTVAEHTLLLTMAGLRRLTSTDGEMRQGKWTGGQQPALVRHLVRVGRNLHVPASWRPVARRVLHASGTSSGPRVESADLAGQTVGIVGWGHIARHYARLLQPFECRILVYSEHASDAELLEAGAERAGLGELLGSSKVVSLHSRLTEKTRHLLGTRQLALLAPGTVLVNTARGDLVDESALLERLQRRDLVACLDVFHQEPLPPKHALRSSPQTILTPHAASSTPQCRYRVGAEAGGILLDWMASREIPAIKPDRALTVV